jgi:hypothetical protein
MVCAANRIFARDDNSRERIGRPAVTMTLGVKMLAARRDDQLERLQLLDPRYNAGLALGRTDDIGETVTI